MKTDKLSISIVIKQEDHTRASELLYLYKVCKDKEDFEKNLKEFIRLAEETAKDNYEFIE